MAYRVEWSPRAIEDAEAIALYIAADSIAYAAAVVKKILDATRNLSRFPLSGRVVPEFGDENIREKFVYSYRIIYRIQEETVTIAAIIHSKRLLELDSSLSVKKLKGLALRRGWGLRSRSRLLVRLFSFRLPAVSLRQSPDA